MILEKIKEANDVKQLSLSECEQLAQEIRDFLRPADTLHRIWVWWN